MAEKITGRLQTPADANGKRVDIHLINSTDEVITPDGQTLTDKLSQSGVQISEDQPTYPCMWFKKK